MYLANRQHVQPAKGIETPHRRGHFQALPIHIHADHHRQVRIARRQHQLLVADGLDSEEVQMLAVGWHMPRILGSEAMDIGDIESTRDEVTNAEGLGQPGGNIRGHGAVGLQGGHRGSELSAGTVEKIEVCLGGDQLGGHEQLPLSCVADSIAT